MNILIINPNSTASMTEKIGREAEAAAAAETQITALNPAGGPPSIQGPEDGAAALPGLTALFDAQVNGKSTYDAVVLACFDDTGLWELRDKSPIPVIGIGEAACHAAMLLGKQFSIVTTLPVSVPVIKGNVEKYGFAKRCANIRASDIPVLDLEKDDSTTKEKLQDEIGYAFDEDGCDSVALGCAGMTDLAAELSQTFKKPVIDGVKAAVGLCEMLHQVRR